MRIAFLSVWFSENMGYIENCLPKAMASLGHEVHVITSTAQVYYDDPSYDSVYRPYLGDSIVPSSSHMVDGFMLHRLDFGTIKGKIFIKGIGRILKKIGPEVVQVFDAASFLTFQGAYYSSSLKYRFFTANHIVESVFPLLGRDKDNLLKKAAFFLTRSVPGYLVSLVTSRCYPATIDALKIAVNYYKVPERKVQLAPLGVDTEIFKPVNDVRRSDLRRSFGVAEDEILCIYTGRFTDGKNPLCLAKAIDMLATHHEPYKALFVGDGPQSEQILQMKNCIIHKFVRYKELPDYYRAADIGVWPRQESTSMLDATGCGLPIIISNLVQATERIEGNGLTYRENDFTDLARVLLDLKDKKYRKELSASGIDKINSRFSWLTIAVNRIEDYKKFTGDRI